VNRKHRNIILALVMALAGVGIVAVLSVTMAKAESLRTNVHFWRQLCWVSMGVVGMLVAARVDYRAWKKVSIALAAAAVVLLAFAFVPVFASASKGAARWIRVGPARFQPSEIAKVALVMACSFILSRPEKSFLRTFAPALGLGLVMAVLVVLEPDFGTAALMIALCMVMIFAAGLEIRYILLAVLPLVFAACALVLARPYRIARVIAFLRPETASGAAGFHIRQSLITIGSGGIFGVGLGESRQCRYFLPESSTDFIFAVIGEQFGFLGAVGLVALYAALVYYGLKAALAARDEFGRNLAFGVTALLGGQAVMNIMVVTALLPTKGIPLPFVSRGGTAVACMMFLAGILANVAAQCGAAPQAEQRPVEAAGEIG